MTKIVSRILKLFTCRLMRDHHGSALVEFALMLPVLIVLGIGGLDFVMYLLLQQKLQNATFSLADLAARDKTLSAAQLDNIFMSVQHVTKPFDFPASGRATVSGISATSDQRPRVYWQRSGAGSLSAASRVGSTGGNARLPADLGIKAGETIIAAELTYEFKPLFGLVLKPTVLHHSAFVKPRLGTLQQLD